MPFPEPPELFRVAHHRAALHALAKQVVVATVAVNTQLTHQADNDGGQRHLGGLLVLRNFGGDGHGLFRKVDVPDLDAIQLVGSDIGVILHEAGKEILQMPLLPQSGKQRLTLRVGHRGPTLLPCQRLGLDGQSGVVGHKAAFQHPAEHGLQPPDDAVAVFRREVLRLHPVNEGNQVGGGHIADGHVGWESCTELGYIRKVGAPRVLRHHLAFDLGFHEVGITLQGHLHRNPFGGGMGLRKAGQHCASFGATGVERRPTLGEEGEEAGADFAFASADEPPFAEVVQLDSLSS